MPSETDTVAYTRGGTNLRLHLSPDVSQPNYYTDFLVENLADCRGRQCLEIGCGCGIVCLAMARAGAKAVVGVDINANAVELSQLNARRNSLAHCATFRTAAFPHGMPQSRFDVVVTEPPNIPTPPDQLGGDTPFHWTNEGGTTGRDVVDSFIEHVPRFLESGGVFQLLQADFVGERETMRLLKAAGFDSVTVQKRQVRPGPLTRSRIGYIEEATGYEFKCDRRGPYFHLVLFTAGG
jgi:release factor glutamine methyltransferase